MRILLSFAPFIAFAIVHRLAGATEGLVAGAIVSIALLARDWFSASRSPKILEVGAALLFTGLAIYALFGDPGWSIAGVRLRVDVGLLLIVLISIAVRRPFTLQYAREQVAPEHWNNAAFMRINTVIAAVWAASFVVQVSADLILIYAPEWPRQISIVAPILALIAAIKFTGWYPEHQQAKRA
jgi:hypothetical protein